MARIAFAWELGANYGHLRRTVPVAESLRAAGHTVVFVAQDLLIARTLLMPKGFGFVAAPRLAPVPSSKPTSNYGQLLAEHGYADRDSLRAGLHAWLTLWRNLDVDVIVIDHAPTALLAARILRKPHLLLGIGFSIPPDTDPLPSLRPWEAISPTQLRRSDAAITENISSVIQELGGVPLRRLGDLFAGVPAMITTFAELDHYGARPGATFIGPTESRGHGKSTEWRHRDRPHVFAYLRTDMRSFEATLAALRNFQNETICVIPDATPALLHRLKDWPIRVFTQALDLNALLNQTDAVVTYGGAGIVAQCMSAGVPMLILPHVLEQYLSAQRVVALEGGLVADEPRSVASIHAQLHELLTNIRYRQGAQRFSQRYASYDCLLASQQAADAIAQLVDSKSPAAAVASPAGRRLLYVWELGSNAGHLERGVSVCNGLRARGWDPVFAVQNVDLAQRILIPSGFQYVNFPAPPPRHRPQRHAPVNYSDLLLERGFDDAATLSARVHAWVELYRWMKPDVLVLDYAPTAQLAAYILGLPSLLICSGFSIPVCSDPLPSIQPRKQISRQDLLAADRRLLENVNIVARELGAPPLAKIGDLFARSPHIVTTFPELDSYVGREPDVHVGPLERVTNYPRTEWRTAGPLRVFAYLRPFIKGLDSMLQALRDCNAEVKCVVVGASSEFVSKHQSDRVEIFTSPIEPRPLLREADLVISYGSAGLIAQSLLAGVPLLLMCDVLEQIRNSLRVVELGAGIAVIENRTPAVLGEAIRKLTSEPSYRTAARHFAAKYQERDRDPCARIVNAIERTCRRSPSPA